MKKLVFQLCLIVGILSITPVLNGQDLSGYRICLDPGHGGHTADDRQIFLPNGIIYWESEGVFEVAYHLKDILEHLGAAVMVTRTDNSDESDIALSERSAIANAFNADVFQSIHTNGGGGSYSLVLYKEVNGQPAFPDAKALSDLMSPVLMELMKTTNHYSRGDMAFLGFNLGVLRNASMPAVLSESSFHDLPAEGLRLKNTEYLKNYAWASAKSLLRYFQKPGFVTGRVGGVVTDVTSGAVINGVEVFCQPDGKEYTGDQNYNGFYAIGDLAPGNYVLTVSREGYLPKNLDISIQANHYLDMDVAIQYFNNGYPNADFFITGLPAGAGEKIQFNASKSTDDGMITGYLWDFGDGSLYGAGVIVEHIYAADGIYVVTLTLTDDEGKQSTLSKQVQISTKAPEAPVFLSAVQSKNGKSIELSWTKNTEQNISRYKILSSFKSDFSDAVLLDSVDASQNSFKIDSFGVYGIPVYFRIVAQNIANKQSEPGNTYGTVLFQKDALQRVLIVDGFNRRSSYTPKTHAFAGKYLRAILANGEFQVSSCNNSALNNASVKLTDFDIVLWFLGDESTANETFSDTEQAKVREYLQNGGKLFVTGAEVGWDLFEKGTASDKFFYNEYLKATFLHDGGAGRSPARGIQGAGFDLVELYFGQVYPEDYPDEIGTYGGSGLILRYANNAGAGIRYRGSFGDSTKEGAIVYIGFPLESVADTQAFNYFTKKLLEFLNNTPVHTSNTEPEISFSIYPTVVQQTFYIGLETDRFTVFRLEMINQAGQIVYKEDFLVNGYGRSFSVSIGHLPMGYYAVKITSENIQEAYKIIKI